MTFSARDPRMNRGRISSGLSTVSPVQLGAQAYWNAAFQSDFTLSGSSVIQWNNHGLGGSNWNLTDGGIAGRRPIYVPGQYVEANGSSNFLLSSAVSFPEPYTLVGQFTFLSESANHYLCDGLALNQASISNDNLPGQGKLLAYNGAFLTTPASQFTDGVPFFFGAIFSIPSGLIQIAGFPPTFGSTGNALTRSGCTLFASGGGGGQFANARCYKLALFPTILTTSQLDDLYTKVWT